MHEIEQALRLALGLDRDSHDLGVLQMGLRAVLVYVAVVLVVRMGKKRFMGRATAFDVILGIMLGSVASRAVTGNAPLVPALAATAVLVLMHWLFSAVALHWHGFGRLIKGRSAVMVRDGHPDRRAMQNAHMTEHDLWEDLRVKGLTELSQVTEARLERSGQLSIIKAADRPRVVEVQVAEGVQTVRIEIA